MKNIILSIQSATFAVKAKRLLNRHGVSCRFMKLDASKSKNGCTHGIEITGEDFFKAVMILKNSDIQYYVYESEGL